MSPNFICPECGNPLLRNEETYECGKCDKEYSIRNGSDSIKSEHNNLLAYFSFFTLSIFGILYTIFSLSIIGLQIFPTINRLTQTNVKINWSFSGSQEIDVIITTILFCAAVLTCFKKIISVPLSIIIFLMIIFPTLISSDYTTSFMNIAFLLTLPIIISLFLITKIFQSNNSKNQFLCGLQNMKHFKLDKFLKVFFFVFVIIEFAALIRWIIFPMVSAVDFQDLSWQFNSLETNLFLAFGLLSPILILLSVTSFLIKPAILRFRSLLSNVDSISFDKDLVPDELKIRETQIEAISYLRKIKKRFSNDLTTERQTLLIVCLVAVFPAIFLSLYPHLIIPEDKSVIFVNDIPRYQKWLEEFSSLPDDAMSRFIGLFTEIDNGSRPLSLLTIHSLSVITNQDQNTILKYLPVLLGPLLVFSTYYLTRSLYPKFFSLAVIVAILTAASHQLVVGSYASFYSNWMSLIVLCVSLAFLVKSMKEDSHFINVILFSIFFTLTLFFHSYTWSFFVAVIAFFLIWSGVHRKKSKKSLRVIGILAIALISVISIDLMRSYFGDVGNSFQNDFANNSTSVGIDQFSNWWSNISTSFNIYLGGFLTNSVLLVLVFLWTITGSYHKTSDRLVYSMLFVSLIPILFGGFVVQSRIIYDVFLQIPAGIMIYKLYQNKQFSFRIPLLAVIILIQFNYAFRALANMNFIYSLE